MIITQGLKDRIVEEAILLEDIDDCVGIKIRNDIGLFIQVVDYGEGKEYFIELNSVDRDNVYEPCKDYNAFSEFRDMKKLIKSIEDYLA